MDPHSLHQFLEKLDPPFTGEALFDHLPDTVFFIKNAAGRYLVVNQTLVERCGVKDKSQLVGRLPSEVLVAPLGESFESQDRRILETGQPLTSVLELHVYPSREVGWCLTTKLPLRNRDAELMGIVGLSQDLRAPNRTTRDYERLAAAVRYAEQNLSSPPTVGRLADVAEMSPYQLDRRMRHVFGLSTGQWLQKIRIDQARQLLQHTAQPIASIALETGYSDQSAFTRQFRQSTGLSPRNYRNAKLASDS